MDHIILPRMEKKFLSPEGGYGNIEKFFFSDNDPMVFGFHRALDADHKYVVKIGNQF